MVRHFFRAARLPPRSLVTVPQTSPAKHPPNQLRPIDVTVRSATPRTSASRSTQLRAGRADKRDMRGIKLARPRQIPLPLEVAHSWGGARKGAGRKPRGRPSMPHTTSAKIEPRYPLQVTIRAAPGLPSLRSARVFAALRRTIARASVDRFRVIHFSIQQDHGHFIVEGDEARRARGGVHGLAIRLALAVNRAVGRKGQVVPDRYHARPLTTPRQMRTSMVYVLKNDSHCTSWLSARNRKRELIHDWCSTGLRPRTAALVEARFDFGAHQFVAPEEPR